MNRERTNAGTRSAPGSDRAFPPDLGAAFAARTGVTLLEGYGSTETNFVIGASPETQKPGTMGRIVDGFQARVVDSNDVELPDGEAGELVLRADEPFAFASGYFGMAEKTVEAWRNLWFHTGDRVIRDENGYFRFVDRLKDAIRRRGENISSYEVEQVLLAHPDIEMAAVFPVRSELAEDEVMAAIVVRPGAAIPPVELMQFCAPRLPYFAVPRFVDFVADLPRTENGKIRKYELRERGVTASTWDREAAGYQPEAGCRVMHNYLTLKICRLSIFDPICRRRLSRRKCVMAERSFAREVQDLKLGNGDVFHGEGILAITKALLQSGVGYVGGYQGAPISHLMDVLADAQDILGDLGVHFETSANEAAAAAMLSASVMYPIRGAVTWKSTAGTNVASDALSNLASGGVTGGALIVIGEDYGEGSSIMQERSHAFAMKSQIWLLDPRPNLESIVKAVEDGFELSEATNTPVMLEVRIRSCHVHGRFAAKDNKRPAFTMAQALENPRRDTNRIVLPPASYMHEKEKIEQRWPAAISFIKERKLNEVFDGRHRRRRHHPAGRHVQWRDPRAAGPWPGGRLGQHPHSALCHERDLPLDRR